MQISARKKKERGEKKRRVRAAETKLNIFLAKKGLELGTSPATQSRKREEEGRSGRRLKKVHEFTGREEFRT